MQAIEKQLLVLESIAKLSNEQGFNVADLVRETGLNSSVIHRTLSVLIGRGYLYQEHKRGQYFTGYKFLLFNSINKYVNGIKKQALPFLDKLCKDTSETVDLQIFDSMNLFSIATVFPKQLLQAVPDTESVQPFPLHCTSTGKILLAFLEDEKYERVTNNRLLTAYTNNTITNKDQLRKEIELIII